MLPDFRVRQRDYLLEIARALTQELDLDKLLGRILQHLHRDAGRAGRADCPARRRRADGGVRGLAGHAAGLPALPRSAILDQISRSRRPRRRFELPEINRLLNELTRSAQPGPADRGGPAAGRPPAGGGGHLHLPRLTPDSFSPNDRALLEQLCQPGRHRRAECPAVHPGQPGKAAHGCPARLAGRRHPHPHRPTNHVERCNPALARMLGLHRRSHSGPAARRGHPLGQATRRA